MRLPFVGGTMRRAAASVELTPAVASGGAGSDGQFRSGSMASPAVGAKVTMWRHFKLDEFRCKHCGENLMKEDFITKLDNLRHEYGVPLKVASGYRCPVHNMAVSTTGPKGPHTTGRAVDFAIERVDCLELLELALASGHFTGIGLNQKGTGRFLHLDDLKAPEHPRPNIWTY